MNSLIRGTTPSLKFTYSDIEDMASINVAYLTIRQEQYRIHHDKWILHHHGYSIRWYYDRWNVSVLQVRRWKWTRYVLQFFLL